MDLKRFRIFLMAGVLMVGMCISNQNVEAAKKRTLFIMGDSKSRYYFAEETPRGGWGQELTVYLKGGKSARAEMPREYKDYPGVIRQRLPKMNIENWGKSGASVKSFVDSGQFEGMLKQVRKNDHVIIAFGHNDARRSSENLATYKTNMTRCIQKIRNKGAIVILVTTPPRNFTSAKSVNINAPVFRKATLDIAKRYKLSCIDLNQECVNYFNFRGKRVYNPWYMKYNPGVNPKYPAGIDDSTHFNQNGAKVLAKIVAVSIQNDKKQKFLSSQFTIKTKNLYKSYTKAKKYKKNKYTKASWKKLIKARDRAWVTLYSPGAANSQYKKTDIALKKAMKGLKKNGKK